jgi:His/Glu/Gln/Arg/opine family amino acid ABC transporter permease subunit
VDHPADPGWAFLLGVTLSVLVGVARLSHRRWVRGAALVYVEFFRGISSIVLLFIVAIALPILLGVGQASLMMLGSLALGANMGGYGAEIVRGSIQAIPKGQTEASIALNLSNTQRLRHVVLPQAIRIILPPFGNLTIEILKGTALVSLVGLADITQAANFIRQQQLFGDAGSRPHHPVPQRPHPLLRDGPDHQRAVPAGRVAVERWFAGGEALEIARRRDARSGEMTAAAVDQVGPPKPWYRRADVMAVILVMALGYIFLFVGVDESTRYRTRLAPRRRRTPSTGCTSGTWCR